MPSDEQFPKDEQPTQPDLKSHLCPHCKGAGGFLVPVSPKGHRMTACAYCKGTRYVSAAQARSYRDQTPPTPKTPSSRPKLPRKK